MSDTRVSRAVGEVVWQSRQSLRGFAKKLGVSPAYLSDLRLGRRRLSNAMAVRLAPHKPKRSVRDWMVLQLDDEITALAAKRKELADG